MAEQQIQGLNRNDLQALLEAVVKAAKEPSESEKAKIEKERLAQLGAFKQAADLAKTEEATKARRWNGCPHFEIYNGRKFHKWNGQVNSDGFVVPVCNICRVEAPKFSASLLPDAGKNGVNFEQWNWPDDAKKLLVELHAKSFPNGCDKATCVVCAKEKK